jgi:hypothetical protein
MYNQIRKHTQWLSNLYSTYEQQRDRERGNNINKKSCKTTCSSSSSRLKKSKEEIPKITDNKSKSIRYSLPTYKVNYNQEERKHASINEFLTKIKLQQYLTLRQTQ